MVMAFFTRGGRALRLSAITLALAALPMLTACTSSPAAFAEKRAPDTGTASVDPAIVAALAPTGRLRASINLGNPVLASLNLQAGWPTLTYMQQKHAHDDNARG